MKPQSAKQKGRRLQQELRELVLETFPHLEADDVRSTPMGSQGSDLMLSPLAQKSFPFSVECKMQENVNIWAALAQATANAQSRTPLVVFSRNRSPRYVALPLEDFLKLVGPTNPMEN